MCTVLLWKQNGFQFYKILRVYRNYLHFSRALLGSSGMSVHGFATAKHSMALVTLQTGPDENYKYVSR